MNVARTSAAWFSLAAIGTEGLEDFRAALVFAYAAPI